MNQYGSCLKGKIMITATLTVVTGLHIGASKEFSAIGAVDNVVVRDPITREPVIPGSSVKGKMRSLLARYRGPSYNVVDDPIEIKRLFGGKDENGLIPARLQFWDLFMNSQNVERIKKMKSTDLYLTEIKFENTISRLTGEANPRQVERVPRGAKFDFCLTYNIEDPSQIDEDFDIIAEGLELLQTDYLGGGGSRGNGRIAFSGFDLRLVVGDQDILAESDLEALKRKLEAIEKNELLHVQA